MFTNGRNVGEGEAEKVRRLVVRSDEQGLDGRKSRGEGRYMHPEPCQHKGKCFPIAGIHGIIQDQQDRSGRWMLKTECESGKGDPERPVFMFDAVATAEGDLWNSKLSSGLLPITPPPTRHGKRAGDGFTGQVRYDLAEMFHA
jgi:hypothetical protein